MPLTIQNKGSVKWLILEVVVGGVLLENVLSRIRDNWKGDVSLAIIILGIFKISNVVG